MADIMEAVKEAVLMLLSVIFYWIQAIIYAFLPASIRGKSVAGETVLITGAGSGIGRLMAVRFAQLGSRLVLWDINSTGNEETARQVKAYGGFVRSYNVDITNREAIYKTANQVKQEVGDVDILVNNAGIVTGKKFLDCPDDLIQKTFEVNTIAHFWTCKAFLPGMVERNHGHVVNIASSAGLLGVNGLADYCASKFGAVGFDESLRFELEMQGKDGVHTTVVCPYYISTGMFEGAKTRFPWILPILEPEDVSNRIIDAILCNQHIIILPKVLYAFMALKGLDNKGQGKDWCAQCQDNVTEWDAMFCLWNSIPLRQHLESLPEFTLLQTSAYKSDMGYNKVYGGSQLNGNFQRETTQQRGLEMIFNRLLPTKVISILSRYFGASNSMDNFQGREKKMH